MLTTLQAPTVREAVAQIEMERAAQEAAAAVTYAPLDARDDVDSFSRRFNTHLDAADRLIAYERRV